MAQAPHEPILYDPYAPLHITFDQGWQTIGDIYNVDTSVPGQVTLDSDMTLGHSMFKEWSDGPAAGHGYGTYTVVAKLEGYKAGPGIVFWPGDDKWPGPEIDLVETMPDWTGRQYGTLHWDGGGYDDYYSQLYPGYVEPGVVHTYQMVWEPGKITMTVDGEHKIDWSVNVPKDYAHGGINLTIGAINLNLETSITVYDIRYDPLYPELAGQYSSVTGATATTTPATTTPATTTPPAPTVDPAPAAEAPVDWNAIAAQVQANYEATGSWYMPDTSMPATPTTTTTTTSPPPATTTSPPPATETHADTSSSAPVDWNALAAQAAANYAATGSWWI